jgi:hypothetical protein
MIRYVKVEYALRMLDPFDADRPFWISENRYPAQPFGIGAWKTDNGLA